MTPKEAAFLEADFNWVSTLQSVWRDSPSHIDGLQGDAGDKIMAAFRQLLAEGAGNTVGQVVNGPAGSGKTHLIGTLRRRVWEVGGWFVLIDIVGITDFWRTAAFGFIRSLRQAMPDGRSQYQSVFEAVLLKVPKEKRLEVINSGEDLGSGAIRTVNIFVRILQSAFSLEGMEHSNVVRALLLQGDPDAAETAYSWLQGLEVDREDRKELGLTAPSPTPEALVRGICWLMSLGGPVMIAIDQIDAIVTAGNVVADKSAGLDDETEARARAIIQILAGGLTDLYDQTNRAMTVITCLGETWSVLQNKALRTALHRFVPTPLLLNSTASGADAVAALIAARLAPAFTRHGELPDQETWPFMPSALAEIEGSWPRTILMRCEEYRQRHLGTGEVPKCTTFQLAGGAPPLPVPPLDTTFEKYVADANIGALAAGLDDGGLLGACVRDALHLYVRQLTLAEPVDALIASLPTDPRPALHARLTFVFHDQKELEKHYCFRVLRHPSAQSVPPRLRAAMTDAGIDKKLPFRHLFIIRDTPMPRGPVNEALAKKLLADGGAIVSIDHEDLRIFVALRDMAAAKLDGFDSWVRDRKPLCNTTFFKTVGLCPPPVTVSEPPPKADPVPGQTDNRPPIDEGKRQGASVDSAPKASPLSGATAIPLGPRHQGGGPGPIESLPLANLTRHTALFAGSGSGKTVLLRRIVEEAALAGVPAIVLDTNNDLARLGQAWPERPASFTDEDAAKAERYARDVEVVVWTPGVAAGRPLTLAVLPDFSVAADGEEREAAVTMAWSTLAPLVGARGASGELKLGVLKEALAAFARESRTGIDAFIEYLADLPDGVSKQTRAQKFGVEMSDQLRAKIAVNPLLNAPGQPLDPATLFTASRPGATRISVINFAGLDAEASRQDFVNQLQMALFTYVKRHPSEAPRLYVCDEAQNFAPSAASTASKASAIALARQGRKFGLGMIFATQGPKGIDTNIVSNCVTHFYGRMSSPALIDATEEMMAAKGRAAKDLGSLTAGLFYFATESTPAPVKVKTPLCLSYHGKPATPEEVVALARG